MYDASSLCSCAARVLYSLNACPWAAVVFKNISSKAACASADFNASPVNPLSPFAATLAVMSDFLIATP
jgi:hypothetical protein